MDRRPIGGGREWARKIGDRIGYFVRAGKPLEQRAGPAVAEEGLLHLIDCRIPALRQLTNKFAGPSRLRGTRQDGIDRDARALCQ